MNLILLIKLTNFNEYELVKKEEKSIWIFIQCYKQMKWNERLALLLYRKWDKDFFVLLVRNTGYSNVNDLASHEGSTPNNSSIMHFYEFFFWKKTVKKIRICLESRVE